MAEQEEESQATGELDLWHVTLAVALLTLLLWGGCQSGWHPPADLPAIPPH